MGRKTDLRLGAAYMNTIEIQTRKPNPERVVAPGEPAQERHQSRQIRHEHHRSIDAQAQPRKSKRVKRVAKIADSQRVVAGTGDTGFSALAELGAGF